MYHLTAFQVTKEKLLFCFFANVRSRGLGNVDPINLIGIWKHDVLRNLFVYLIGPIFLTYALGDISLTLSFD